MSYTDLNGEIDVSYCIGGMLCGKPVTASPVPDGFVCTMLTDLPPNSGVAFGPELRAVALFQNYERRDGVWLCRGYHRGFGR